MNPLNENLSKPNPDSGRAKDSRWRVRRGFLLGCGAVLIALILPAVLLHSRTLQRTFLLFAGVAILVGWAFVLLEKPKVDWRAATALIASFYLVVSLPIFCFELFPRKWFLSVPHYHWVSIYAEPWAHWGHILSTSAVVCSLFGRGRARIAFVTGAALMWAIWESIQIWSV